MTMSADQVEPRWMFQVLCCCFRLLRWPRVEIVSSFQFIDVLYACVRRKNCGESVSDRSILYGRMKSDPTKDTQVIKKNSDWSDMHMNTMRNFRFFCVNHWSVCCCVGCLLQDFIRPHSPCDKNDQSEISLLHTAGSAHVCQVDALCSKALRQLRSSPNCTACRRERER